MAALPVITDVIRCTQSGLCPNGQPWANTFHVRKDNAATFAAAIAAIDAEVTKIYTTLVPYGAGTQSWSASANTSASFTQSRYTPLDGSTASTVIARSAPGTNGATALSSDTALVVSFPTAKRGPRYRGRIYIAGYTESMNDTGGVVTTATRVEIQAAWNAFVVAIAVHADLFAMVVASYKFSTSEGVTGAVVNNIWDRQKRRLR